MFGPETKVSTSEVKPTALQESKSTQKSAAYSFKTFKGLITDAPYDAAYCAIHRGDGIHIPKQSRQNFRRLVGEIKSLNAAERTLFKIWREKIVPQFTLKHATRKIEFDTLEPLALRQQKGGNVLNSHTLGGEERRHTSYFVLGIGSQHPTPKFIGSATENDTIILQVGKIAAELREKNSKTLHDNVNINLWKVSKLLNGFFIAGHIVQYQRSEELPPVVFGGIERQVCFNNDRMEKTYHYRNLKDNSQTSRTVKYTDEIFAADKNLNSIFDALFFQFILELRYLGLELSNEDQLITVFQILFPSWVYPEAQVPQAIPLKETKDLNITPYLQLQKRTEVTCLLQRRWFLAATKGDVAELKTCLQEANELSIALLNAVNEMYSSALMVAIHFRNPAASNFLLSVGIDITIFNKYQEDALIVAASVNDLKIAKELINGVLNPHLKLVKHKILPNMPKLLEVIVTRGLLEFLKFILDNFTIPTNCAILDTVAVAHVSDEVREKMFSLLLESKVDINVRNKYDGSTALIEAARNNKPPLVKKLVECKADLNCTPYSGDDKGETALHIAAKAGYVEVVRCLASAKGIDLEALNLQGDSPYFSVVAEINRIQQDLHALQDVVETKNDGFSDELDNLRAIADEIKKCKEKTERVAQLTAHLEQMQMIKAELERLGVNVKPPVKTLAQKASNQKYNCVALVVGMLHGEPAVVIGRRFNPITSQPHGFYVLPGGGIDSRDESAVAAVLRELKEETGIIAQPDEAKQLHAFEVTYPNQEGYTYARTQFFLIDLGSKLNDIKPKSGSDLTSVTILPWKYIKEELYSAGEEKESKPFTGYFYNRVRLAQSNALLIKSVFKNSKPDKPLTVILSAEEQQELNAALELESTKGYLQFLDFSHENDRVKLKELVAQGFDIVGSHVIVTACQYNFAVVPFLIEELGADVNKLHQATLTTPLIGAVEGGHFTLAKILIEQYKADIMLGKSGRSVFMAALKRGNFEFVAYLLAKKKGRLPQDIAGPLMVTAIFRGRGEIVRKLLAENVLDLNQSYSKVSRPEEYPFSTPVTPLMEAATSGQFNLVALLLEHGASVYLAGDSSKSIFAALKTYVAIFINREQRRDAIKDYSSAEIAQYMRLYDRHYPQQYEDYKPILQLIIAAAKKNLNQYFAEDLQQLEASLTELEKMRSAMNTTTALESKGDSKAEQPKLGL